MLISLILAKFWGVLLIIAGASFLLNQTFYKKILEDALRHPLFILLFGYLDVITGLVVVLVHNVWVWDWPIVITIFGWILLARGIFRLMFPQAVLNLAAKVLLYNRTQMILLIASIALLLLGLFLTYKGFYWQGKPWYEVQF